MEKKGIPRLYYLDWLRVLAILTVFIFHCGRFFDLEEWHIRNPTTYFGMNVWTYFLAGFLIVSHEGLQTRIRRQRWLSLAAGGVVFVAALIVVLTQGDPDFGTPIYPLFFSLFSLYSWCFVLAIPGFGMQHLTVNTPFLHYANEAVLPFYSLHQMVIISIGFLVVRWAIPDLLKLVLIAASSFVLIMMLYEFLVRRYNVIRFLFGMKLLPKAPAAQSTEAPGALPTVEPSRCWRIWKEKTTWKNRSSSLSRQSNWRPCRQARLCPRQPFGPKPGVCSLSTTSACF